MAFEHVATELPHVSLVTVTECVVQPDVGVKFVSVDRQSGGPRCVTPCPKLRPYSSSFTSHPVASAPASMHFRTRTIRSLRSSRFGALTCQYAFVYEAMTLATFGVSRKAQWILSSGLSCCRSIETLLYEATRASSALMPAQGFPPACALFPENSQRMSLRAFINSPPTPSHWTPGNMVLGPGCLETVSTGASRFASGNARTPSA